MHDLIRFYFDHGKSDDAMVLTDLENAENWGYAIRSGKVVPVIIDAGYSAEVMHHYYPEAVAELNESSKLLEIKNANLRFWNSLDDITKKNFMAVRIKKNAANPLFRNDISRIKTYKDVLDADCSNLATIFERFRTYVTLTKSDSTEKLTYIKTQFHILKILERASKVISNFSKTHLKKLQ